METLDGRSIYAAAFKDGIRPDKPMTVTQYADRYRYLPATGSAEPGLYRSSRTPYLVEIMDCLSPSHPCQDVIFMKASQIGGSESGFNWLAYIMDRAPAPTMMVQPTIGMAETVSKQRIAPMIAESPTLSEKVANGTMLMKEFPGGVLIMAGANSASGLRSMPIKNLMLDEIDAYPPDVAGEGSAIGLAEARTRTFSRRKRFKLSSPTIKGKSEIESAYRASDRRRYHIPCPHCQQYQWLKWSQMKWKKKPDDTPDLDSVYYECEHCREPIREHHKAKFLAGGKWIAENPNSEIPGFHLSALYSPLGWFSWRDAVDQWCKAQGNPEKLKVFINTILGETFEIRSEDAPDWHSLYMRREIYPMGTVPARVCLLTAAVDVQKDRLECTIFGWNRREAWVIDHVVLEGSTSKPITEAPWTDLDDILQRDYENSSGSVFRIQKTAIDTGYNTTKVYDYVRDRGQRQIMAIKGSDKQMMPIGTPKGIEVKTSSGKRIKRGIRLYEVGSSILKSEVYGRLKRRAPTDHEIDHYGFPSDYIHFPMLGEEYFKQLTAEVETYSKNKTGHNKRQWVKVHPANEALDLAVYNIAAYYGLGANRWKEARWQKLEAQYGCPVRRERPKAEKPAEPKKASKPEKKVRKTSNQGDSFW